MNKARALRGVSSLTLLLGLSTAVVACEGGEIDGMSVLVGAGGAANEGAAGSSAPSGGMAGRAAGGAAGSAGANEGTAGAAGAAGTAGANDGAAGANGGSAGTNDGAAGAGATGGTGGASGGSAGAAGANGGTAGAGGADGGTSGASGTSGAAGANGGTAGTSGAAGTSGSAGASGAAGASDGAAGTGGGGAAGNAGAAGGFPAKCEKPDDQFAAALKDRFASGDAITIISATGAATFGNEVNQAPRNGNGEPIVDGWGGKENGLEAAVASLLAAGLDDAAIANGAVNILYWGAAIDDSITSFIFRANEGVVFRVWSLGGKNAAADGAFQDIFNYQASDAHTDASAAYGATRKFLRDHRGINPTGRVGFIGHSWGGAVTEDLLRHLAQIAADAAKNDPGGDFALSYAVTLGVPQLIFGEIFNSDPGVYTQSSSSGSTKLDVTYLEVDRPDDPVHNLNPFGDGAGHNYIITIANCFRGVYHVSTDAIACNGTQGGC